MPNEQHLTARQKGFISRLNTALGVLLLYSRSASRAHHGNSLFWVGRRRRFVQSTKFNGWAERLG
jgi:hypothetical protein